MATSLEEFELTHRGIKQHCTGTESDVYDCTVQLYLTAFISQEAFEKCWAHSLLRAVLHCHSPGVATAATVARRLRIDVHDNDDDDDDKDNA